MSLLSHSMGLGAARLLEKVFAFVIILVASRLYGSEGLGQFFYYFSLACLFLPLIDLGMPKLLMQDWYQGEQDRRRRQFGQMLLCKVTLSGLALILAMLVDLLVRGDAANPIAVGFAVLAIALENTATLVRTPDQANGRWDLEALVPLAARCVTLGLLFGLSGRLDSGWQIAILYATANGVGLLVSLRALRGFVPRFGMPGGWATLIRRGIPFSMTTVFVMISLHIDSVMLGYFSLEEVGLYNAGYRVVLVGIAVTGGASHALFPRIVRLREEGAQREAATMVGRILRVLLIFAVAGSAGGILVSGDLMEMLYGDEFRAAGLPFAILCLLLPLGAANNILAHALEATGGQKTAMWITLRSACFNVAANLALIPFLGMVGAAITTVCTEGVSLLQLVIKVLRSEDRNADLAELWRVVPFSILIGGSFALLIPLSFWLQIAAGTGIVVASLALLYRFWFAGLSLKGDPQCAS